MADTPFGALAPAGAAFGTLSPGEQGTLPPNVLDKIFAHLMGKVGSAVMAPGRALNSAAPMTSDQMIAPAADLAGLLTLGAGSVPAEANTLRAGIRPYQNVPQPLMGYRKAGPQKEFGETNYPHEQPVEITFKNGDSFTDAIEGMNPDHAVERAYRNWPDAIHIRAIDK